MRGVKWDALAFCCPGERTLMIVLNPAKAETRQTATLMEEFSHHLLGREPCKIAINPNTGLLERSYDKAQEHEAELAALPGLLPALQPSTPPPASSSDGITAPESALTGKSASHSQAFACGLKSTTEAYAASGALARAPD